ncbi:MAG TPA: hypothetical protein VK081_00475 [Planctomycetota bacterium]|nr:hypothetical protein [Planctomycetota bacterium]
MRLLTLVVFFLSSLAAQADRVVVATHTIGPAATALFDVDLASGSIAPIGRFPLDHLPPLAVEIDAVNRDVIVALADPTGASTLARLRLVGTTVAQTTVLGPVPGIVTSLAQAWNGRLVTTTAAGVFVTERNGGAAVQVAALPFASALEPYSIHGTQVLVVQSGAPGFDPRLRWIDLATGQTIGGPYVFAGHRPLGLTGVGDLPTGLSRQILSQDDGTVALSVNFTNPVPLALQPSLPPGATVAMRMRGFDGVALGGAAHPYLKSFAWPSGTQWTMLAGPLPGDPVDFAFRPAAAAKVVRFADPCDSMFLDPDPAGGPPRIGNPGFALRLQHGAGASAALLVVGASDRQAFTLPLPAPLPGGCRLQVSPDVVLATTTDPFGTATVPLGVPASPTLAGGIVFAQWLQPAASGIAASNAGAVWLDF